MLHVAGAQPPHAVNLHLFTQNRSFSGKRTIFCCNASISIGPTSTQSQESSNSTPAPASSQTSEPETTSSSTFTKTKIPSKKKHIPERLYPWLIVGIGNPGNKFQKTRHNVGFEIIDAIAEAESIKLNTIQQKALTGKGQIGPSQVGPLAAYYRIPIQHLLVIYDDMTLEFGLMRLLKRGGSTTNNGVKSVIEHLKGCRFFPRLRIGIGSPPGTMDPGAFVLQRFDDPEREEMDGLIAQVPVLIREMITEGIEKTASKWNEVRKSKMTGLTPEELELVKQL
ncbi:hypothetical protein KP509_36G064500 [Ceratopteris richardii]|uniref:peptidyl-tRNA hydrolase n=1 Tax=Ceratopteris richardii TaxID=49495 RepID=A0A8T2QDY8_CERRI|nr:hypothetical protein KP509_36G064500 [Ceratopteris richardii]